MSCARSKATATWWAIASASSWSSSSLTYLQRFAVDTLKVDPSFVQALPEESAATIIQTVSTAAHGLNMTVTAEGIETEAQADQLRVLGCDYGQGYHFTRPLPSGEVAAVLHPRHGPEAAVIGDTIYLPGGSTDQTVGVTPMFDEFGH